jgi:glycosyltransferase involved in cell wall biosynthesis
MRILLITSHPYEPPWNDGVKNIVRRLAQYLSNNDEDVTIICPGWCSSPRRAGEFGEEILCVPPATTDGFWGRFSLWVSMVRRIRGTTEENKPDVALVFASASFFLGLRVLILRSILGSRIILYVSGLSQPAFGVNWFLRNTETMVGSPFLLHWFPGATVAYPVTPVHLRPVESSQTPQYAQDSFSLLYLGWVSKVRGIEYLLRGLAIARRQTRRSLKLVLALSGSGSERNQQLGQLIADLGLEDAVSVHGIVDVNEAYHAADVVIIARQEPIRMSFPVRILEALSFNKPLIVTSVCDMGHLIDGCALVVEPRNPEGLAYAIVRLVEDANLYQRLSGNCATVLQKYEPDRTLATIHTVLRRVAGERS